MVSKLQKPPPKTGEEEQLKPCPYTTIVIIIIDSTINLILASSKNVFHFSRYGAVIRKFFFNA